MVEPAEKIKRHSFIPGLFFTFSITCLCDGGFYTGSARRVFDPAVHASDF